jgi:thiamine pyrophosphokinase
MYMKRAVIFANGNLSDTGLAVKIIRNDDYIVCADGGLKLALKLGITPRVVLGDFDSVSAFDLKNIPEAKTEFIKFPKTKNKSDLELALDFIINQGYGSILIFGLLGDRIDHFVSNIFLLTEFSLKHINLDTHIYEGKTEIFIIRKKLKINGKKGDTVSIIPVKTALECITTTGFKYILKQDTLFTGSTRGVSNIMTGNSASIKFSAGLAVVTHERSDPNC